MFTGRKLFATLLALFCLVLPSHFIRFVYAAACHDGVWSAGEYCGYDAVATTTVADMNHDCLVDALDLQLFAHEFMVNAMGPNLSGDFKSTGPPGPPPCGGNLLCPDNRVTLADYSFFATKMGLTASPCTAVPIPSVCNGSVALSYSANPNVIANNITQAPGVYNVNVVVNGITNVEMVELILRASSNISLVNISGNGFDLTAGLCGPTGSVPDLEQVIVLATPVASGPAIVATLQYVVNDSKPASITILPTSSTCSYAQSRWTDSSVSLSHKWASMQGVGINGPTSAAIATCGGVGQILGQVYSDKNPNCSYDSGTDDLLAGLVVQAGTYYAITDASGNYSFTVPPATYTVKMASTINDPWKKFSPCQSPLTYPVTVLAGGTYSNKNFAMLPLAKITGQVYRDFSITTPCTKDGIDLPVQNRKMLAVGSTNYYSFTDVNGNYNLDVPAGPYLVSNAPVGGDPWALPGCQPASYSFTALSNTTTSGKDFALSLANPSAPCNIFLNLISHGFNSLPYPCHIILSGPCPGAEHEYIVTLGEDILSGVILGHQAQLDINLDPKFTISTVTSDYTISIVSSPSAHERVVAIISDIYPGGTCTVKVHATPSTDGPYTNTVTMTDGGIGCTGTMTRTLTENSYCPCDPNDMLVQPRGCGPDGEVAMDQPLTYSIKFENVGTGRAHNIFIEDVLDEDLDVSTLSLVSSSHPVTGFQVGGNKLVISLEGVDLAGTLGPETNLGEVVFTVRALPFEDQHDGYVENKASVFFDFNDPVVTNTVKNTFLDEPCAVPVGRDPLPTSNYLGSNYPNPFNPQTTIPYGLQARGHVTIAIYNINGSLIRTLVSEDKAAGWYTVNWDGRDQRGNQVASGVYFSKMRAGSFSVSKKLVMLK